MQISKHQINNESTITTCKRERQQHNVHNGSTKKMQTKREQQQQTKTHRERNNKNRITVTTP
jgi:hypothetical protein